MIFILYSNDYELFFGRNFRQEKDVLLEPTERLVAVCRDIGIPMTFFCDVACPWRYRELGFADFPADMEQQLVALVRQGHDVQAHLHPHWLHAQIVRDREGGTSFRFSPSDFLLGTHLDAEGERAYEFSRELLERARNYLVALLKPHDQDYRCIAFRAGGYGIQPDPASLLSALRDTGFIIDSSIAPGMVLANEINRIDFTRVPSKANYWLSPESGLFTTAAAGIFEIPVAAAYVGRTALVRNTMRTFLLGRTNGNRSAGVSLGCPVQDTAEPRGLFARAARYVARIGRGWGMLELCKNPQLMIDITRRYIDVVAEEGRDVFFSFSCHSKGIQRPHLDALVDYHQRLQHLYGSSLRAITYQKAAQLIAG